MDLIQVLPSNISLLSFLRYESSTPTLGALEVALSFRVRESVSL